jgi:hypothetical protein
METFLSSYSFHGQNFIDPENYIEPDFHVKNLDIMNCEELAMLNKTQIRKYYQLVNNKIIDYLDLLEDSILEQVVSCKDLKFTKMELYIA